MWEPEPVKNKFTLRIVSAIILLFSFFEVSYPFPRLDCCSLVKFGQFGIGLGVYTFFSSASGNINYGGWWAMLPVFLFVGFGVFSTNRNVVLTSSILAIIAIIFVAAAIVNDVVGYYRISQLSGCYNVKTGEGSGDSECLTTFDDNADPPQCMCSSATQDSNCYSYTLTYGDDCDSIRGLYTNDLAASVSVLVICLLLTLVYIVLSCLSACTKDQEYNKTDSIAAEDGTSSATAAAVLEVQMSTSPLTAVDSSSSSSSASKSHLVSSSSASVDVIVAGSSDDDVV